MFTLIGEVATIIITILTAVGLAGLFGLMVVESFGVPPLPSEVILPFAGYLVATGVFPLWPTVVLAVAGSLVGSFIAYAVGRWWRDRVTRIGFGPIRLEERHLARMDAWFARHGEATVALARLVPIVRAYISYPAGSARMKPARFGLFTLLGMIPFTLAFIYAGIVLGHRWREVTAFFQYIDYLFFALLIAAVAYLVVVYLTRIRSQTPGSSTNPPPPAPAPGNAAPPPPSWDESHH
jgi:membrane protein DedA with SNARE-associated domain